MGIILLNSCADIYTKPFDFLGPNEVHFGIQEPYQTNKLPCKDSVVYRSPTDSFNIGLNLKHILLKTEKSYKKVDRYYFPISRNDSSSHILLDYYQKYLIKVVVISKNKEHNKVWLESIEKHFDKKMDWYTNPEDKLITYGSLQKKVINVYALLYPDDELYLQIIHNGYRNPFVCRNDPSWIMRSRIRKPF